MALSRAGTVPRECLSLGRKEGSAFLAEGKAKSTVLGAARVVMAKRRRPLQVLHSMDSRLWSFMAMGCRWLQISGLVGSGR